MAATLAGVCQVPLTSVLLLFELTQDYRIVLPLLGAVGVTSWITSGSNIRRRDGGNTMKLGPGNNSTPQQQPAETFSSTYSLPAKGSYESNLCKIDSSLCLEDRDDDETKELAKRILVSQAMRTRYVTVLMSTLLTEAVTLMLAEKQSCAVIVDDDSLLIGLLTLGDIQEFSKFSKERSRRPEVTLTMLYCL